MLTMIPQKFLLIGAIGMASFALTFSIYMLGKAQARRAWRRLVLRKQDNSGALRLAIIPKEDGSMELYIPNPGLKQLRRGGMLEAVVQGSGDRQMIFRVVSDGGRTQ